MTCRVDESDYTEIDNKEIPSHNSTQIQLQQNVSYITASVAHKTDKPADEYATLLVTLFVFHISVLTTVQNRSLYLCCSKGDTR